MTPPNSDRVFVEIVAKQKGCVLCDLAVAILEEIQETLEEGILSWTIVDVGDRAGLVRYGDLARLCGRKPPVPSLVINGILAFENIPDPNALSGAVNEIITRSSSGADEEAKTR